MKRKTGMFYKMLTPLTFAVNGCVPGEKAEDNTVVLKETPTCSDGAYFPDKDWRTSSPEEQGMDSRLLLDMFQTIKNEKLPIHSVLIIRNGYLVCEAYLQPFNRNVRHDLFSATKSITSTLIGIAIEEGKLKGADQKITDVFPDLKIPGNNLNTENMTIENVLTMSAGHAADSVDASIDSVNWAKDFFSLPFSTEPGTRFLYDSGATHLLAVILQKTTGQSVDSYAKKRLFNPMGIKDYSWEKSRERIHTGGWGIRMRPVDMAKFGYLVLNKGNWKGKQLVSSQWLEMAAQKHIDSYWGETKGDGYGYQWWMNSFGGFRADGFAGQKIFVMPELNMVVVMTAGENGSEAFGTNRLMGDFIVPSAKSSDPLPANLKTEKELKAFIQELENPEPEVIPQLPDAAGRISGKKFKMDGAFMPEIALDFGANGDCIFAFRQQGKTYKLPVGLDGIYRVSKASRVGTLVWYPPYDSVGLKGRWEGSDTFIIDWQYVSEPYKQEYKFIFDGNKVKLEVREYVVGCAGPQQPFAEYSGAC